MSRAKLCISHAQTATHFPTAISQHNTFRISSCKKCKLARQCCGRLHQVCRLSQVRREWGRSDLRYRKRNRPAVGRRLPLSLPRAKELPAENEECVYKMRKAIKRDSHDTISLPVVLILSLAFNSGKKFCVADNSAGHLSEDTAKVVVAMTACSVIPPNACNNSTILYGLTYRRTSLEYNNGPLTWLAFYSASDLPIGWTRDL